MPVTVIDNLVLGPGSFLSLMRGLVLAALFFNATLPSAQETEPDGFSDLRLTTDSVGPHRFIAAHGRRGLINGYAAEGLDIWAYPFQIVSNYTVDFRTPGRTSSVRGQDTVSRIDYQPEWTDRIYIGPDFQVRERLFVPVDFSGAIITYTVESNNPLEINVHTAPVLNLMWPGGLGGQDVRWNPSLSAFVLSEPVHRYTALIGSPAISAHDAVVNRAAQGGNGAELGFTLTLPPRGSASVFVALNPPHIANEGALYSRLIENHQSLLNEASEHYAHAKRDRLQLVCPDERVNRAFAWAEIALEQAWVCNADLGCGYVGGYGPTRAARRPQYDWFFAGDGLINAQADLAAGNWDHARDELEFILHYQNKKTGMIWHELSQSAGLIDWASKFPYMFVHVDTTFQFLGAVAQYVTTTGDLEFARRHWTELESAYRYCVGVLDPKTSLPRIPSDKEGANEQDREEDDLGLSTSWVSAAVGFAELARLTGHTSQAMEALQAEKNARSTIPERYWDQNQSFWISGHTVNGNSMTVLRSGPSDAIDLHIFNDKQNERLLDRLASSSFQTAWGARGVALGSLGFEPDSYASGSVWPVATGPLATTFWNSGRPATGLAIWQTLIPLSFLDSRGHMHEAFSGAVYRPQTESVSEQTWSSASFIHSTVRGLLGLEVDSAASRVVFAPRTPQNWPEVLINRIHIQDAFLSLRLHRSAESVSVEINNSGPPVQFVFRPVLPLGATYTGASSAGRPASVKIQRDPQQTSAEMVASLPHGVSKLQISFRGGLSIIPSATDPVLGDPDTEPHVIGVHCDGSKLTLNVDVPADRSSSLILETPWTIKAAGGISVEQLQPMQLRLTFPSQPGSASAFRNLRAVLPILQQPERAQHPN